jgi:hypothetical protein
MIHTYTVTRKWGVFVRFFTCATSFTVFGKFDVNITIDKSYTLGGSGYLQNPNEIGHGYQDEAVAVKIRKEQKFDWHVWFMIYLGR